MAELTLSRGDIAGIAQVPNDALTFWLRQGLIVPIEAAGGTGRHLRFKRYEAKIAAMLAQGRRAGLNVDALRGLATPLREAYVWIDENGVTKADWEPLVDTDARGWWIERMKPAEEVRSRIERLAAALEQKDFLRRRTILNLLAEDTVLSLYYSDDDAWLLSDVYSLDEGLPHPFCIMFDVAKIIGSLVWTREIGR